MISVVWAPTEYYRNAFKAPIAFRAFAVVLSVAIVAALIVALRAFASAAGSRAGSATARVAALRDRPDLVFVTAWVLFTVVGWLVTVFASSDLSPRVLAVVAAPIATAFGALLGGRRAHRKSPAAPLVLGLTAISFALVVDVWLAIQVVRVVPQPYWIHGIS